MSQYFGGDADVDMLSSFITSVPEIHGTKTLRTLADEEMYEVKYDTPQIKRDPESESSSQDMDVDPAIARVDAAAQLPHETLNQGLVWYRSTLEHALPRGVPQLDAPYPRLALNAARAMTQLFGMNLRRALQPTPNARGAPTKKARPAKVKAPPEPAEDSVPPPPAKKARKEKKEKKEKKRSSKTTAAPPPPGVVTPVMDDRLNQLWNSSVIPPAFKHTDEFHFLWTHASSAFLLWALRNGNKDSVLLAMMHDHNTPVAPGFSTGDTARALPGSVERAFPGTPPSSEAVRFGQAGLTTAISFLRLFKVPPSMELEKTPIWIAEAMHGKHDDVAQLLVEYRKWCKPLGAAWAGADTVGKARAAVAKYKEEHQQRAPVVKKVVVKKEMSFLDNEEEEEEEDAMDVDEPLPTVAAEQIPLPPAMPIEVPHADELDMHKLCEIAAQGEPLTKAQNDFVKRHAETLFSVRARPSKDALENVLHEWHALHVWEFGRQPGGGAASEAIFGHEFAHFLIALCTILDAARVKHREPMPHDFDWLQLKAYGGTKPDAYKF